MTALPHQQSNYIKNMCFYSFLHSLPKYKMAYQYKSYVLFSNGISNEII